MNLDPMLRSLYRCPRRPYYVRAPGFNHTSAGIRVMHYLVNALNMVGEEAYINTPAISSRLRTPVLDPSIIKWHTEIQKREPVVIYPEVTLDNPLNARTVVRWLLNYPGRIHQQGEVTYPESDLISHYHRWAVPPHWTRPVHQLYLPCVDPDEMPAGDPNQVRDLEIIYGHRYRNAGYAYAPRHQKRLDAGTMLDLSSHPRGREEFSYYLRRAKVVYVYEPSAIVMDAGLSGCPAVIMRSPFVENYDPIQDPETQGTWMGGVNREIDDPDPSAEELKHIQEALIGYRDFWMKHLVPMTLESMRNFIEITQEA